MIDYHVHTSFSPDGQSTLEEYCKRAELIGCEGFCVTDHLDLGYSDPKFENVQGVQASARAQQEARKTSKIQILRGVEAGYKAETANETAMVLSGLEFDYIINSVHEVGGKDPYFPEFFEDKTRTEAYGAYLEAVYESLDAPYEYSVVGHLGYVYRHAPYPLAVMEWSEFPDLYDGILMRLIYLGKGLEINTSSMRTSGSLMPCISVLRRYVELGGEIITLGSDSHAVRRLCEGFSHTRELLLASGVRYLADFKELKPTLSYIK